MDEIADGVRYAGGNGTSDYWRGFNDGIDKLLDAAISSSSATETQDGERHPDDGHEHSWGCRRCGVDPSPRQMAATPTPDDRDREVERAMHVAFFRATGDDPGPHATGNATCQQLVRELALLGFGLTRLDAGLRASGGN